MLPHEDIGLGYLAYVIIFGAFVAVFVVVHPTIQAIQRRFKREGKWEAIIYTIILTPPLVYFGAKLLARLLLR